jgi:hypothetical protein
MLGACQTIPDAYNFTPNYVAPSGHQIHAQLQSIVVTTADSSERIGEIPEESELVPIVQEWERALSAALSRSKNFDSKSNNKVNLTVKVLKVENNLIIPFITQQVFQSTTDVTVRYQIVEVGSGRILLSKDISSTGSMNSSWAGVFKLFKSVDRESENIAIQLNIEDLIQILNTGNDLL